MADGNPIRIGQANTASNPGDETSLSRNEATNRTVFVARNLNAGGGIHGEASDISPGVQGTSTSGIGVFGVSTGGFGVVGESTGALAGVAGRSAFFGGVFVGPRTPPPPALTEVSAWMAMSSKLLESTRRPCRTRMARSGCCIPP